MEITYEQKTDVCYHVFSDVHDEYIEEEDVEKVLLTVQLLLDNGFKNIRVYKQTEWNSEDGVFEDGNCILTLGSFPV